MFCTAKGELCRVPHLREQRRCSLILDHSTPDSQRQPSATTAQVRSSKQLVYRPLYTSTYVLDELVTLLLSHENHDVASTALERVRQSPTIVVHPDKADFDTTCEQFARYENYTISFTDHMTGVLAAERGINHVFTFDSDHFRTHGLVAVPDDTGDV